MLSEVQELTAQIEDFLSDKPGFSTTKSHADAIITVRAPNGTEVQYDGYEVLLYSLASKKLGHGIQLNVNKIEGEEVFVLNSSAHYNLSEYVLKKNREVLVYPEEIHSVTISAQVSDNPCPYCVLTLLSTGTWRRHDLSKSELLYAAVFDLPIEEQEDGSFTFTKLRETMKLLRSEIEAYSA